LKEKALSKKILCKLKAKGYKRNSMQNFNIYITKKKKKNPNFKVEAQLNHKMDIKENLMIPKNIKILESFKIPKSQIIQHIKLETTN
jgi:hypothetical protein